MARGISALERGDEPRSPIVVRDIQLNETVSMTNDTPGYGTTAIQGLPEGNIKLIAAVLSGVTFTHSGDGNITDTFDGDFALGTGADENGTLSGDEVDLIASTAMETAESGASTGNRGVSTATEEVIIDNTDGTDEINLNVLIDGGSISGAEDVTVTGSLHIAYIVLGDD